MKLVPILIAILVTGFLYLAVMERDAVMAYVNGLSGGTTTTETAEQAPVDAEVAQDAEPVAIEREIIPINVMAIHSVAQDVQSGILLRGRTAATRRVDVKAETTGLVISPPLTKGTQVAAGDLLCELDPGTRGAAVVQAQAALTSARANEEATSRLAERGLAAENQAISARASLEGAIAALENAERELERLTITAPYDGQLANDTSELGALLQPGMNCATVLDLTAMKLVGYAPERDVSDIKLGALAGGRLISGQEVVGEVTYIANSADPLTRTFEVEVQVPNVDGTIRDGATAEILISLAGVQAHLVPQSTLTLNDLGEIGVRIVNADNTAGFRAVEIIRDTADGIWISGLDDSMNIITVGQEFVSNGSPVNPTYEEDLAQ